MRRGAEQPRHPFDGLYEGTLVVRGSGTFPVSIQLLGGAGETAWKSNTRCPSPVQLNLNVDLDGKVKGKLRFPANSACVTQTVVDISGGIENDTIRLSYLAFAATGTMQGDFDLKRR
jgi:hypothetical protein